MLSKGEVIWNAFSRRAASLSPSSAKIVMSSTSIQAVQVKEFSTTLDGLDPFALVCVDEWEITCAMPEAKADSDPSAVYIHWDNILLVTEVPPEAFAQTRMSLNRNNHIS